MSVGSVFAYVLISSWLFVTLVCQHTNWQKPFISKDIFNVIPRWTFFAPNPGIRDYHLVAREVKGSIPQPWIIAFQEGTRTSYSWAWNPSKRGKKVLNDAVQSLKVLTRIEGIGNEGIPFTLPYLVLLSAAQNAVGTSERGFVQFAVIEAHGHENRNLEATFISHIHPFGVGKHNDGGRGFFGYEDSFRSLKHTINS